MEAASQKKEYNENKILFTFFQINCSPLSPCVFLIAVLTSVLLIYHNFYNHSSAKWYLDDL